MPLPVPVVLDRTPYGTGVLDLSPLVDGGVQWSSVVPGGFASCSFSLRGDFRSLLKQLPYLSTLRVLGDAGNVLWEGQIEDLAPTLNEGDVGVKVQAFGFQNVLKEAGIREIYSKRDMDWIACMTPIGSSFGASSVPSPNIQAMSGQFDPTDLTKSGVQISANGGVSIPNLAGQWMDYQFPSPPPGISVANGGFFSTLTMLGGDAGTTKWQAQLWQLVGSTWTELAATAAVGPANFNHAFTSSAPNVIRIGCANNSGAAAVLAATDLCQFSNIRILGLISEDVAGTGFYGGTLLTSIVNQFAVINPGVIEAGTDFTVDHLDASVRRFGYDVIQEVAQYYLREWAVWEDALFHWRTPNLSQPQWIIPIAQMLAMDLDASTVNSRRSVLLQYADAASGVAAEASGSSTDRRNPYVLNGRNKQVLVEASFPMTSNTAAQFAAIIAQEVGFGPVPASGSITVPGETVVQHAQGNAKKAWEIRAGDNITIPEMPLADLFTQDGRGECLFHVISAEADTEAGTVVFTLDSYGSKRSDVLMARLAAVTNALGG